MYSVGPERSTGPSIEVLDPNPEREPFQNKKPSACLLLYCFAFEVKDQKDWPSVGPGDAAESSSTEQRDSRGTLMLYTWLNTRGCSLAVWFSEDKGGAWPSADVCLLILVVRTSLLSADGAAGEEPWRDVETSKTFNKKQNTEAVWDSGAFCLFLAFGSWSVERRGWIQTIEMDKDEEIKVNAHKKKCKVTSLNS